jgi:hypothetical protein
MSHNASACAGKLFERRSPDLGQEFSKSRTVSEEDAVILKASLGSGGDIPPANSMSPGISLEAGPGGQAGLERFAFGLNPATAATVDPTPFPPATRTSGGLRNTAYPYQTRLEDPTSSFRHLNKVFCFAQNKGNGRLFQSSK